MDPAFLWAFIARGFATTIAIETPVLLAGLPQTHTTQRKLTAAVWLTACTYPIVVLVLPLLMHADVNRTQYLWVAETFAPLAECALFSLAFHKDVPLRKRWRDWAVITLANLCSFIIGSYL
jgi:hypothetical protein